METWFLSCANMHPTINRECKIIGSLSHYCETVIQVVLGPWSALRCVVDVEFLQRRSFSLHLTLMLALPCTSSARFDEWWHIERDSGTQKYRRRSEAAVSSRSVGNETERTQNQRPRNPLMRCEFSPNIGGRYGQLHMPKAQWPLFAKF